MEVMDREKLFRKIQEVEFTAVDLNLFLDTHPTCQQALMDYNTVTCELMKLKKMYETHYSPLANYGNSPSQYPWRWVDDPWPWEMQE
jgi:spore coat protein JB